MADIFNPGAWTPAKVKAFRTAFEAFLNVVKIDSKEQGGGYILADRIYDAQRIVLDEIFDGLSSDIHSFDVLKSRQLGISTITRTLVVFWLGFFQGIKGGLIFDTGDHKEEARRDIEALIDALPSTVKFPRIRTRNRSMLILENGSTLLFMAAGVKKGKSSGTLGRSSGLNLIWASEMCSWENDEGVKSLESSIAKVFPDRLYVWESTARGPNIRKEMWENALADDLRWKAIFVGWWAHPGQKLLRGTPAYERYAAAPLSPTEKRRIKEVKELYGWEVTDEQLAWYRRQVDPVGDGEDDHREYVDDDLTRQDHPWTADEAFVLSGSTFFPTDAINERMKTTVSSKYTGYKFYPGTDFLGTRVEQVRSAREIMLKVWQEPVHNAEYVLAFDVAYGHNEDNDRSAFQILRCYADTMEQVAEFASASTPTDHYAWCILHCVAWYKNVLMIGELNGPGESVFKSYQETLKLVKTGYLRGEARTAGLADAFNNVRQFIYARPDSMTNGSVFQFKTTSQLKITIFERLRDNICGKRLDIASIDTLREMKDIVRNGDEIKGEGKTKDDRAFALALGSWAWHEKVRGRMSSQNRTRSAERAKETQSVTDQFRLFSQNTMTAFFANKERARKAVARSEIRSGWRSRR